MTHNADQNLVNYCYKNLREGIIRGDFSPGEKLKIAKLREYFNVGPTPLREALSRLTASGLVDAEENKGFRVKKVSRAEVRDIYATFNQIEILALSQSIELGDTSWEAGIVAALHTLSVIETSPTPIDSLLWLEKNYAFHYSLIAACRSPCLLKIRKDLYQLFDRYCHLSLLINKDALVLNNKDHVEIAKAVLQRDKDKSVRLMTLHLEKSLEQILNAKVL